MKKTNQKTSKFANRALVVGLLFIFSTCAFALAQDMGISMPKIEQFVEFTK